MGPAAGPTPLAVARPRQTGVPDIAYLIPLDPPYVPDENPTGNYRRVFDLPESWTGTPAVVRSEGVESCARAWLNGVELGVTRGSRLAAEFDVTTALRPGRNVLAALNLPAAPAAERALRRALATDDVPMHLARVAAGLGAPQSLAELGLTEHDLTEVITQARSRPYANPRPVSADDIRTLLTDALHGTLAP
ncbi:sugar-binding domain-containing protein [Streptomyces lutosisoli]|uniref:beta-galactosidase n=1 Tax=Streptomyces lutosisoli TaxID=2665721 RepID=A0ABW2W2D3_9ACTN